MAPRFRPPAFEVTPALRWMLLRAFGPLAAAAPAIPPGAAVVEMARRFELAGRIAARHGRPALFREVGEAAAADLWRERLRAVAVGLRLRDLRHEVAATAAALQLPIVWLKFAALAAAGLLAAGSREAADVDLLAPAERAAELAAALRERGWTSSPLPGYEHHLPPLQHPHGGCLEVHRLLLGVRPVPRGPSATLATLSAAGLLSSRRQPGDPPEEWGDFLAPPALSAHLLAHALGQHAASPQAYSLLKTIGDLIDCGAAGGGADAVAANRRARGLVAADLAPDAFDAALDLAAALAAGEDLLAGAERPAASTLLRHMLAGRLDADYAAGLRLNALRPPPGEGGAARRLLAASAATVFLSRAQVDAIYGAPRRPLGYLGRRLARPFDLLRRTGRYAWQAWRARRRRTGR